MNNKEDILARCIDDVRAGKRSVAECLVRYPEYAIELRPLLEIALGLKPLEAKPSPDFMARARRHLVMAMQEPEPGYEDHSERLHRRFIPMKLAMSVTAGLLVVAVAGSTTVYASRSSLPGDTLYPVKTGVEKVQLGLTFDQEARASRHVDLVQRRVDETAALAAQTEGINPSTTSRLADQLDDALEEIGKTKPSAAAELIRRLAESSVHNEVVLEEITTDAPEQVQATLRETAEVVRRGKLIAEVSYSNSEFLDTRPSVKDRELDEGRFKLSGVLHSIERDTWKVDGVTLREVHYSGDVPPLNSRVRIEGMNKKERVFITRLEREDTPRTDVSVEGVFKGASEDGKVWTVGGIPVEVSGGGDVPREGDEVRLKGPSQEGKVTVSDKETRQAGSAGVEIEGTLTAVDADAGVISVKQAGTLFKIVVKGASLRTSERRDLSLSQLRRYEGRGVEVEGLHKKDGVFYAATVRVEDDDDDEGDSRQETNDRSDGDRDGDD